MFPSLDDSILDPFSPSLIPAHWYYDVDEKGVLY